MKVELELYLTPAELEGATRKDPKIGTIEAVKKVEAELLPFESKTDRWELTLKMDGQNYEWLANKTSLRRIVKAHGDETENWVGKKLNLWITEQNIRGEMRGIIYGEPVAEE